MMFSMARRSTYHPIAEGDEAQKSQQNQNDEDEHRYDEEDPVGTAPLMGDSAAMSPNVSFKCEKAVDPEMMSVRGQDGRTSGASRAHQWDHIGDVDQFFAFIYEYFLNKGFLCIALRSAFTLFRFAFVVLFSTFLLQCVDYDVIFANRNTTWDGAPLPAKRRIQDAILPQCHARLNPLVRLALFLAALVWLWQLLRLCYRLVQFYRIRQFFAAELHLPDADLPNTSWAQVVAQLCRAQQRTQLIVNKRSIDSLDIYQRILRHKNYFVAMVYKSLLPPQIRLPFIGRVHYLSSGLRFNLEWLLFWGPWSPWKSSYALKDEFRDKDALERIAQNMRKMLTLMAAVNLALFPFIFVYQLLFSFFSVSEQFRRDPNTFGMRKYSNYGREKLRHFNEMDHELDTRLNRSYEFAVRYTDQFVSPVAKIVAKNCAFVAASVFVCLLALTAYDEDTLKIDHITTIMTLAGGAVLACRVFIPNEHMVFCQQLLMRQIVANIHYAPRAWLAKAHSTDVFAEFAQIFRLRAELLAEELASPLLTPMILYTCIRPRVTEIVAFLHKYTVHIDGLGDVCSLAQMDISRDGDIRLASMNQSLLVKDGELDAKQQHRNGCGKVELSLLNFATQNPDWQPSKQCAEFIRNVKDLVSNDPISLSVTSDELPAVADNTSSAFIQPSIIGHPTTVATQQPQLHQSAIATGQDQQNQNQDPLLAASTTSTGLGDETHAPPPPLASSTTASIVHQRPTARTSQSQQSQQQQQMRMMAASSFIQPPSLAGAIVQPSVVQESNFRAMEMSMQALAVNRMLFLNNNNADPAGGNNMHSRYRSVGGGGYGSIFMGGSTAPRGLHGGGAMDSMAESNLFGVPAVEQSRML